MKIPQEKLEEFSKQYNQLEKLLEEAVLRGDKEKISDYSKQLSLLSPIVQKYKEYKQIQEEMLSLQEISSAEMAQLVDEEKKRLEEKIEKLTEEIFQFFYSQFSQENKKNIIIEIRAGVGGEEAALFAQELLKMYLNYAERKKLKAEILDLHPTDLGGIKEVILNIKGKDVYGNLKYESGVHRVQRIPITEAGGRIHTSTATVVVLPEVEEVELKIDEKDLRIDTFSSGGKGGQHLNRTYSAVRIVHLPTGIIVQCQDERSQLKNKDKAMKILRARLKRKLDEERESKISQERKSQIGKGERSEKIRTYNFPQNRVTDHRLEKSFYNLEEIMNGNLDLIIQYLKEKELEEIFENGNISYN